MSDGHDGHDTNQRLVEAVKAKIERPINLRRTRLTRMKVGNVELFLRVRHTEKGARLFVLGPDGLEIEHISLTEPNRKA